MSEEAETKAVNAERKLKLEKPELLMLWSLMTQLKPRTTRQYKRRII